MSKKKRPSSDIETDTTQDWFIPVVLRRDAYARSYAISRDEARAEFFRALKEVESKLLTSLAERVLPPYRRHFRPNKNQEHLMWRDRLFIIGQLELSRAILSQKEERIQVPSLIQLDAELRGWASDWHLAWEDKDNGLQNAWILDYALQTLNRWCRSERTEELDWEYALYDFEAGGVKFLDHSKWISREEPLRFEFPGWDSEVSTWKNYKGKAEEAFKSYLKEYRAFKNPKSSEGQAKDKREDRHYRWLADYQLHPEWKRSDVARKYLVDSRNVGNVIRSLPVFLDLELYPRKSSSRRKSISRARPHLSD